MTHSELRNNDVCEAVLTRNAKTVYRTALLRVGNRHDAEDIMQDVFVRYIRYAPVFESADHEKAWFIRATVNLTKSFFGKAHRRREVPLDEDLRYEGPGPDEPGDVVNAVMHLSKDKRTAIHLFYYENLSTKEIAAAMGKSEAAVRTLLTRARNDLKIALGDEYAKEENRNV